MRWAEMLNRVASGWTTWAVAGIVEASILLGVVALVMLIAHKRLPAVAAHLALLVVLVKALLPIGIPVPRPELSGWFGGGEARLPARVSESSVEATRVSPTASPAKTRAEVHSVADIENSAVPRDAAVATSAGPSVRLSWQSYALLGWLFVSLGLMVNVVHTQRKLQRALAHAFVPSGSPIEPIVRELSARLGVRRRIAVVVGPSDISPGIAGCRRPMLIVPRGLETRLSREQLEWVLLHELAHVRRGDLWALLFVRVCQSIAWFNPAVWLASHGAEHYRECACDELALQHASCSRGECGEAFLTLLAGASDQPGFAMEFLPHRRLRKYRLRRLVDDRFTSKVFGKRGSAVFVVGALILAALSLAERPVAAEVASESKSSGGETGERPARADSPSRIEDSQALVGRILRQQKAEIHSARMRVKALHLSTAKQNPLQQGHDLAVRADYEIESLLDRTDFSRPDCLRQLRDVLVDGNLIVDQPAYQTIKLDWQRINQRESRHRIALDDKFIFTYDNRVAVEYLPRDRAAFVQPSPRITWDTGLGHLAENLWHSGPAAFASMLRSYDGEPRLTAIEQRRDGMIELAMTGLPLKAAAEGNRAVQHMALQLTGDEQVIRFDMSDDSHSSPVRELDFQEYPGGVVFPRVCISQDFSDRATRLLRITVTIIEHAEFNVDIPDSEFRMTVPASTAVWDRRGELKLRAAEKATDDVLTLFER